MQFFSILSIQLALLITGVLIAIALGLKNKNEIIGLGYLLGSGIVSILFLILHWFFNFNLDKNTTTISILMVAGIFFLFNLVLGKFKKQKPLSNLKMLKTFKNLKKIEKTILYFILLFVAYGFFENYFWPIIDWDALAFYDFRAKVIALNGNMLEGIELKYFFQYPPYTSFLHVFGYVFGAERVKLVYSLIYSSILLSFYALLRRKQDRLISLFFTLILGSIPMILEHSIMAYSNLSYTAFFSLGLIYLWYYYEKARTPDLLTGALLIGLSTWVRSTEPFWLAAAFVILMSLIKHKKNILLSVLGFAFLNLPGRIWRIFLTYLDSLSEIKIIDTTSHATNAISDFFAQEQSVLSIFTRIFEVSSYLALTLSPDFLLLFLLLVLTFIGNNRSNKLENWSLIILLGIVFAGTLVFSFTFKTWNQIGGSIVRMSMIFVPLLLFVIAKDLKYDKKN